MNTSQYTYSNANDDDEAMRNRRMFLQSAAVGGGVVLLGGFGKYRSTQAARTEFQSKLLSEANPLLTEKVHSEMQSLPNRASEEIRTWFHGPCLNAANFAASVTSEGFCERLASCQNENERLNLFQIQFFRDVVSPDDILKRVHLIAEETGDELDQNWKSFCVTIAKRWNVHLRPYSLSLPDEWFDSLEPQIRLKLDQSIKDARVLGQRPALGETFQKVGMSAVLLLPLVAAGPWMVPVFVLAAIAPLYSYFWARFRDTSTEIRQTISRRVANLALRMSTEFREEVKNSISRLQQWQEEVIQITAKNHAENAISYF